MKNEGALALAVLAGAPAADTVGHGLVAGAAWMVFLGLAVATWRCGRHVLDSGIAASVAAAIVGAAAAAALPLLADVPVAAPPQSLLLALAAAAAAALPLRDLLRAATGVAAVLTLAGVCRDMLPATNAPVAAAIGLALLAALLKLWPPPTPPAST